MSGLLASRQSSIPWSVVRDYTMVMGRADERATRLALFHTQAADC